MPRRQQMSAGLLPLTLLLLLPGLSSRVWDLVQQIPSRCENPQHNTSTAPESHIAMCNRYTRMTETGRQTFKSLNLTESDFNCKSWIDYDILRANIVFTSTSGKSCSAGGFNVLVFYAPFTMTFNISVADNPQNWNAGDSKLAAPFEAGEPTVKVQLLSNTSGFNYNTVLLYLSRSDIGQMDFSINFQAVPNCTRILEVKCGLSDGKDYDSAR